MNTKCMVVAVTVLLTSLVHAATFPGSISREPLVRGNVSDRLSIGVGYDRIKRDIRYRGSSQTVDLDADSISGYAGYNVLSWLTAFVTAGATSLKDDQLTSSDYALRVSAGLNAYFWEGDVLTPGFAAGRISIKGTAEVLRHEADTSAGTSDWLEWVVALPVGYEMFDRYPAARSGLATSLALYAGPAVSVLDGDLALAPGFKQGFRQDQAFGAVAGADIFFAPSVSLGFKALIFDQVSTGASLRFHF